MSTEQNEPSPTKKPFDFSMGKFTPPASSNPFIYSSATSSAAAHTSVPLLKPIESNLVDSIDSTNPFSLSNDLLIKSQDEELQQDNLNHFDFGCTSRDEEDKQSASGSSGESAKHSAFSQSLRANSSGGSSLSQSPNQQTNIGTTIAGVVGGGASKLQALHKWFKGDSFDGRDFSKKRNELSELASVSVRDLVKAIGGQDSKSNGNEMTPPLYSRSSSPVAIPVGKIIFKSIYKTI